MSFYFRYEVFKVRLIYIAPVATRCALPQPAPGFANRFARLRLAQLFCSSRLARHMSSRFAVQAQPPVPPHGGAI